MVLLPKEFIIAYFPFLLYGKYVALATGKARPKATLWQRTHSKQRRTEANRTVYLYPAIDFASIYILISCNYLWLCLALLSGHRQTCVCMYVPVCVPVCACSLWNFSRVERILCLLIFAVNFILIGQMLLQIYKFICWHIQFVVKDSPRALKII